MYVKICMYSSCNLLYIIRNKMNLNCRFRGHEDCLTSICPFRSQKTTHFHCNRSGCQFIFKNKADMEKHKNYHTKDEAMNKDGFRKYMKEDNCGHKACTFNGNVNHIHCIRDKCEYVLHSSGQLYVHKRKHDRKDNEMAYRKYKLIGVSADNAERPPSSNGSIASESSTPPLNFQRDKNHPFNMVQPHLLPINSSPSVFPPTDMIKDRVRYLVSFQLSLPNFNLYKKKKINKYLKIFSRQKVYFFLYI